MALSLVGRLTWRKASLVAIEYLLIVGAVEVAALLRLGYLGESYYVRRASLIAMVLQVCLHYCDLYDLRTLKDRRDLVVGLLQALGSASLVLAVLYYWFPGLIIGRGVFAIAAVFIVLLVASWRIGFEWLSISVAPAERLLILGTSAAAVDLARELHDRRAEIGVELVGFLDVQPERVGTSLLNPGIIGTVADIPTIVRERKVDRVVVSLADARGKLSMDQLLEMKLKDGIQFDYLASVYEQYTGKIAVENLRPSWLIFSEGFRKGRLLSLAKRVSDMVLAGAGLVLASPIMGLVAVAIKVLSPGPIVYCQQRVGLNGRPFTICKFRSMRVNAEAGTGAVWSTTGDPRVTPIGRFLRRTRLDELPQLWSVMRGDMSFVGPRPERPEFVAELTQQIPFYGQRHVVRPGLTGWAQVRYSYGASVEDAMQKLQYDLFYIKNLSFAFDVFILLETIKTVLVRRGS
jgi:sugar transferase (PEP-CTERM system associated)